MENVWTNPRTQAERIYKSQTARLLGKDYKTVLKYWDMTGKIMQVISLLPEEYADMDVEVRIYGTRWNLLKTILNKKESYIGIIDFFVLLKIATLGGYSGEETNKIELYPFSLPKSEKDNAELIFNDKEENSPEKIENKHVPKFIPDGYSKLEETNYETYYQIIYSNAEKNELIYEQFTLNYDVTINTEGINTKEIFINGATGITYSQNGLTTVIFSDGIYAYSISGYEDESILKQMAESIK